MNCVDVVAVFIVTTNNNYWSTTSVYNIKLYNKQIICESCGSCELSLVATSKWKIKFDVRWRCELVMLVSIYVVAWQCFRCVKLTGKTVRWLMKFDNLLKCVVGKVVTFDWNIQKSSLFWRFLMIFCESAVEMYYSRSFHKNH